MDSSPAPDLGPIPDEVWAQIEQVLLRPAAPAEPARSEEAGGSRVPLRLSGAALLILPAGLCGVLLLVGPGAGWVLSAYCSVVAVCGATGGCLLASRRPLLGLWGGALAGLGGVYAVALASAL